MDLNRKLSSKLVAFDAKNRTIGYSDEENHRRFLNEIIDIGKLDTNEITIRAVCPYVWTNPDKWYAEHEPLIRYQRDTNAENEIVSA